MYPYTFGGVVRRKGQRTPLRPNPAMKVFPTAWDHTHDIDNQFYHTIKGGLPSLVAELQTATSGQVDLSDPVFSYVEDMFSRAVGGAVYEPLTNDDAWNSMKKTAGPGEPFSSVYHTKREMEVEENKCPQWLVDLSSQVVQHLVEGTDYPEVAFTAHSKRDKYKLSKITSGRFRSIQGLDVCLHFLMVKYLGGMIDVFDDNMPHVFIRCDATSWARDVTYGFKDHCTFGADYTAFDKSIPANVNVWVQKLVFKHTQAPPAFISWLADMVSTAPVATPDGEVLQRFGGNPSGQYLTTATNCLYHIAMNYRVYATVFGCELYEVPENIKFLVTGDDELAGVLPRDIPRLNLSLVQTLFMEKYGIATKFDLLDGQLYPPRLACHAPYLSGVSVIAGGHALRLPLIPQRSLANWHCRPRDDKPQDLVDTCVGIHADVAVYYIASRLDHTTPIPYCVQTFMQWFEGYRRTHPELDWSAYRGLGELFAPYLPQAH